MRTRLLGSLLVVSMACGPTPEVAPVNSISAPRLELDALLRERGFEPEQLVTREVEKSGSTWYSFEHQGIALEGFGGKQGKDAERVTLPMVRNEATFGSATPTITPEQAIAAVREALEAPDLGARATLVWQPQMSWRARPDVAEPSNTDDYERVLTSLTLSYRVITERPLDGPAWTALVDAHTGAVTALERQALDLKTRVNARARGAYAGTVTLSVEKDDAVQTLPYTLIDAYGYRYIAITDQYVDSRGNLVTELAPVQSASAAFGDGLHYNPNLDELTPNGQTIAVDTAAGVDQTWRFFREVMARNGPNGAGLSGTVRTHERENNIEWEYDTRLLSVGFKSRSGIGLKSLGTHDFVAHELGHDYFVTSVYANPSVIDGPGSEAIGLNEGTADVIGFASEVYADARRQAQTIDQVSPSVTNFTIGEQALGAQARDMFFVEKPFWYPSIGNEDPHDSGGPLSRMFALLAYGCPTGSPLPGSTTPGPQPAGQCYPSAGLKMTGALSIFACLIDRLPPGATYADARRIALHECAYEMDGLVYGRPRTRAVANAFASIMVGAPADGTPPVVNGSCRQNMGDILCSGTATDAEPPRPFTSGGTATLDGVTSAAVIGFDNWKATFANPAHGPHSVRVTMRDVWGNQTSITSGVTLDKMPPAVSAAIGGDDNAPIFTGTATDPSGVAWAEFKRTATNRVEFTAPPYVWAPNTTDWADGLHPVDFSASDVHGNRATRTYQVRIDRTPPVINLSVTGGTSGYVINASVTDSTVVSEVTFLVDGVEIGTDTSVPFSWPWVPSGPASTISARATDSFSNTGTASIAAPQDTTGPTITLLPQIVGTVVTVGVSVSDPCGIVTPYSFLLDGVLMVSPTTSPTTVALNPQLTPGPHQVTVIAMDRCGNSSTVSAAFNTTQTPPVITSIARNDADKKRPKFTVGCTSTSGVHHVEVRKNGVIIASDNTAPYEFTIDTSSWPDGTSHLVFHCSGINGLASTPETRQVEADNTAPTFSLAVSGAQITYLIESPSPSDGHGIKSVTFLAGLALGSQQHVATSAPYSFFHQLPAPFSGDYPIRVTAEDTWGNRASRLYLCAINTQYTQPYSVYCAPQ